MIMESRLHNLTGEDVNLSASFDGGAWQSVTLSGGQSVYFDDSVEFSNGASMVRGGEFADVYISLAGFHHSGELPDYYEVFFQGMGFGFLLAGAVLTLWIIRLLKRGVVEH